MKLTLELVERIRKSKLTETGAPAPAPAPVIEPPQPNPFETQAVVTDTPEPTRVKLGSARTVVEPVTNFEETLKNISQADFEKNRSSIMERHRRQGGW